MAESSRKRIDAMTAEQRRALAHALDERLGSDATAEVGASTHLVAFVRPNGGAPATEASLRSELSKQLPPHMIPSRFVSVREMPRTPNGKVDRQALLEQMAKASPVVKAERNGTPQTQAQRKLAEIWADVLGVDDVGIHDSFFELGGHSLIAMRLFARIREQMGTSLPMGMLFQASTVEQMALMLTRPTHDYQNCLVAIQPEGVRRPFFCVHGVGGEILCFRDLARHLGTERPFFGLQAIGLDQRDAPDDRVERMAERYIEAIRPVDPDGPYLLGGYSSGGTIAYEMARQLRAAGKEVKLLAVLENLPPNVVNPSSRWRLARLSKFLRNMPLWVYHDLLRNDLRTTWRRGRGKIDLWRQQLKRQRKVTAAIPIEPDTKDLFGVAALEPYRENFLRTHYRAMIQYEPKPYDGPITVFRSRARPLFHQEDMESAWAQLVPEVESHVVPGAHDQMLNEPYVATLAKYLRACLDTAE